MSDKTPTQSPDSSERQESARPVTRRDLLRRAAVSMPAVLTLQSGAALARSSNLISASTTSYTDDAGRTYCLDVESVYPVDGSRGLYDLGEPPYARIYAINDRDYRAAPDSGAPTISQADFCRSGGPVYVRATDVKYTDQGWSQMKVPRGALVSATALSSFAGNIHITDL